MEDYITRRFLCIVLILCRREPARPQVRQEMMMLKTFATPMYSQPSSVPVWKEVIQRKGGGTDH